MSIEALNILLPKFHISAYQAFLAQALKYLAPLTSDVIVLQIRSPLTTDIVVLQIRFDVNSALPN